MLGWRRSGLGVGWGEDACGVANSKLALVLLLFVAVEDTPHKQSPQYDGISLNMLLQHFGGITRAAEILGKRRAKDYNALRQGCLYVGSGERRH